MPQKPKTKANSAPPDLVTLSFKAPRSLRTILDEVVVTLDTDRSKFIREAIREHSARKRPGKTTAAA